jgi:hypothetical protein
MEKWIARLVFLFLILGLPLSGFSKNLKIDTYGEYSPDWELPDDFGADSLPVFSAHIKGNLKGMACGWQATAFYRLAMMLNTDNLQQIIDNWKSLAFPLALYTVATYFPIVKEAMVGAEYISDMIASLSNMNCQSAMKMIEAYNKKTSKIVRACVLKRLGKNINIWTASPSQIEKALSDVSEAEIRKAYDYCMNHASLLDALPLSDVKKWLKKLNPRKWIACNYVKAFGLKDLGKEYNADRKILVEGGNLETVAKLYLLAITPEFVIDERTKRVLLKPIYLTDHGKKMPVNLTTLGGVLREKIDKDFKKLEERVKGNLNGFIDTVKQLNEKYYVRNTDDILAYFKLWWYAYKRYEQARREGNELLAQRILISIKDYENALKRQYYRWAERNMLQMALDYLNKVEAMAQNQDITGAIGCNE